MSRRSLTAQFALVAALAVLVTALVSYPLVANASQDQARQQLAAQADIVGDVVARAETGQPGTGLVRLRSVLAAEGVSVHVVRRRPPQAPVTEADVAVTRAGGRVSDVRDTPSGSVFVEGRPVSDGTSVFLVQDSSVARSQTGLALRRLGFALLLGLLAAVGVGVLAARRI